MSRIHDKKKTQNSTDSTPSNPAIEQAIAASATDSEQSKDNEHYTADETVEQTSFSELAYLYWIKRATLEGSKLTPKLRKRLYLKTAFGSLLIIWVFAAIFIYLAPTNYVSKWVLILPGAAAGSSLSLDSLGQASTSSISPYMSSAIDPRENYKAISMSTLLMESAAHYLDLPTSAINKPKLKLPSQTGLMEYSVKAATPEAAQERGWAMYRSLQNILTDLRADEIGLREVGIKRGLKSYSTRVKETQKQLLDFQSERGLVTLDQFKELAITIERLRHSKVTILAELEGLNASYILYENHLGITDAQAAILLKLNNDKLFQQLVEKHNAANTQYIENAGRLGTRHPVLVSLQAELDSILKSMKQRFKIIIGFQDDDLLNLLTLNDVDGRAEMMQEFISIASNRNATQSEVDSLTSQINTWEQRLQHSNDDAAKLADLQREHQLASAVLTSAMAKMDVGKSDIYTAYPMLQLLSAPSLPSSPDKLAVILIAFGGLCASFMSLVGLCILWIRKPLLRKMLTKKSSTTA
ncbi:exopolysaccharide biosynthesis protein [Shewanella sp. 10N.7]|uniref:GumC family protein n=1 Tax=Shewanella sp. 10N.7 TaxID=2885093 RepID=UPI001E483C10|nr:exopolysaccharide biosynthesis protein [Shewanella sp. 10N.7]MCC4834791.1 exopolysaccharide biosynthesis protein [Shewanella sp. 10N.7]